MKNQLSFFATAADLSALIRAVESEGPLQFVKAGVFDTPNVEYQESLLKVPNLGSAIFGDANLEPTYLVSAPGTHLEVRPVPQRRGGTRYAIDQIANQLTIAFRPGGELNATCLIAGQVGTVSANPISLALYRKFSGQVRRHFKRIKSFHVGEHAEELLRQGSRLTANYKSPRLYDLKCE